MEQITSLSNKILEGFQQINETYKNLFSQDEKEKWADEVWDMLQKTYAKLPGGLAGSGFESKEAMVAKIPFWKLTIRNGKLVAVGMYKDKGGRKRVASGSDGTEQGKTDLIKSSIDDIKLMRAFAEISKAPLAVLNKNVDVAKYAIPVEDVKAKMPRKKFRPCPEDDFEYKKYPKLREFLYQRQLGNGEWHTKIAVGNINAAPIIVD
jgi:hypothetical protein